MHEFFVLRLRHRASIGRYFPEIKSHLPGIVETSLTIRTGFPLPVDFFRLRYSATARRLEHSRQLLSWHRQIGRPRYRSDGPLGMFDPECFQQLLVIVAVNTATITSSC